MRSWGHQCRRGESTSAARFRLLHAVDTSTASGLRDHALLLMMSTYGLGAGEMIRLQLRDIDWNAGTLQMSHSLEHAHPGRAPGRGRDYRSDCLAQQRPEAPL